MSIPHQLPLCTLRLPHCCHLQGQLCSARGCQSDEKRWIAVEYSTNEVRGWILGGFVEDEPTVRQSNIHSAYSAIYNHSRANESA